MAHNLEVKLEADNIWSQFVTRKFKVSEDFIRGAVTILDNLPDSITYITDVDISESSLNHNLFHIRADEYLDEAKFNDSRYPVKSESDINIGYPVELRGIRWQKYIQSKELNNIKRYTAKIEYSRSGIVNVVHFSSVDYLSGIMSANYWVDTNIEISNVYDNFKLCKMSFIYRDEIITNASLSYRRVFSKILINAYRHLIKDICNIIYEYYQNICEWETTPGKCLTKCDNSKYCLYHQGVIKDTSSLICEVVLSTI